MSDIDDYDEYDNAPKALRDHARKLEKQLADLQKKFDEAEQARTAAEKAVKSQSLTSILRDKGVKPALAKWLEKDEVDATPEAVDVWLKENGEFFNIQPKAEPEANATTEDDPQGQANITPEQEAALRASQTLDASGVSPGEVNVIQKLQSIDPNAYETHEEFLAALQTAMS